MQLTQASLKRLEGVHPDLVKVVKRAAEITAQPFQITEGLRTLSRQRELVRKGASRTLKSRHIAAPNGLGHAIDVVAMIGGRVSWEVPLYHRIADAFKRAAREMGVPLEWGGDWASFFDGPHFQLPWATYPGVHSVKDAPMPQPTPRELATLVPGSRGDAVKALQDNLNRLGFSAGKPDGDFGPRTRAAVQAASATLTGKETDIVTVALAETIRKAAAKASAREA
ncbi:peptidoglycan-binding protein [Bosea sp. (in: a-proteobacteria)]|uniref:peptidoglycan-binding protein n=1 Tax=Bosea sp. (in: a-proteobacteria) TaxID=1871050 RepID=UPI002734DAD5|nr:peptidoglycan-binding protein [Bosea sp. (in: a-proteobacteria)]MDP3408208.1 M15 family metallopeptidase [Bosea sp. (in: a-proteobacteria)]